MLDIKELLEDGIDRIEADVELREELEREGATLHIDGIGEMHNAHVVDIEFERLECFALQE